MILCMAMRIMIFCVVVVGTINEVAKIKTEKKYTTGLDKGKI